MGMGGLREGERVEGWEMDDREGKDEGAEL